MSYVLKEYVVRVEHVQDCQRNRLCSPTCVRVFDGYEVDFRIRFPGANRTDRHRERVPKEWAKTKSRAERWAQEREAYWMKPGPKEESHCADITVVQLVEQWIAERKAMNVDSIIDEEPRLRQHVLPLLETLKLSEVRPRHARDLVLTLRKTPSPKGGLLAPRTVRGIYFLVRQVFQYAVIQEFLPGNPILVDRGVLPKRIDKDATWRSGAVFTAEEVEKLISDSRIPEDRRVRYAIEFLASLRTGQASALRWRDHDPKLEPLGRLTSARTYDSRHKKLKDHTKTDAVHEIPVHPVLARVLAQWKLRGWKEWMGRAPAPDDLILPTEEENPPEGRTGRRRFPLALRDPGFRERRHSHTPHGELSPPPGPRGGGREDPPGTHASSPEGCVRPVPHGGLGGALRAGAVRQGGPAGRSGRAAGAAGEGARFWR